MSKSFLAAIFDLDGVITDTSRLHAEAWKSVLDPVVDYAFDITADYQKFIAGRSRVDGLRAFFSGRGYAVTDSQLGALCYEKNQRYLSLLDVVGVKVNAEMLARIALYNSLGIKIAVATSSKNARAVLSRASLVLPGVLVDGNDVERLGLRSKPEPDIFIYAARVLGVDFAECVVFEDSREALLKVFPATGVLVEFA